MAKLLRAQYFVADIAVFPASRWLGRRGSDASRTPSSVCRRRRRCQRQEQPSSPISGSPPYSSAPGDAPWGFSRRFTGVDRTTRELLDLTVERPNATPKSDGRIETALDG